MSLQMQASRVPVGKQLQQLAGTAATGIPAHSHHRDHRRGCSAAWQGF